MSEFVPEQTPESLNDMIKRTLQALNQLLGEATKYGEITGDLEDFRTQFLLVSQLSSEIKGDDDCSRGAALNLIVLISALDAQCTYMEARVSALKSQVSGIAAWYQSLFAGIKKLSAVLWQFICTFLKPKGWSVAGDLSLGNPMFGFSGGVRLCVDFGS